MNGIELKKIPKFLEGEPLPVGYFDSPDPYVNAPSCYVDLPALARYAKSIRKDITDLTREEISRFSIRQ